MPLRFSACGQMISPSGFQHHRRRFEENVLIIITEGWLHITAEGHALSAGAGEYVFLRAGEEHFGHCPTKGKLSYLWAHFQADDEFEPACGDPDAYAYLLAEKGKLSGAGRTAQLFRQLMDISLEERLYPRRMADYAMSLLLMEITQEHRSGQNRAETLPAAVILAKAWIKDHFYQPFTVSELADAVGYRADYLSALFKRSTGISIVRYTNGLRIKTAKTLLSNYDVHIKEAALSCGFPDEKYFMRVFKQMEGITPAQYQRSFSRISIHQAFS